MSNSESLSVELRQDFIQLIAKHTGLKVREREQATLCEKIFLRMKALQLTLPENYYQLLESPTLESSQEWQKFAVDITNLESYFFRDQGQFFLLRNYILPEIIQRQQHCKTLRIGSAGCSTGEEPYSLAILLKEMIPELEQWNLVILGIDINQEALQKAKTGIYRPWSFRNVDEEIKQRYFQLINNQYHLAQPIKEMLNFQTLNLVKDSFPQTNTELRDLDLILCRNVFIYFESSAIAKVLDKFYQTLQPGGYLITGHAELSDQNLSQFQTKVFPESLVYQRQADNLVNTPLLSQANNYLPLEYLSLTDNENDFDKTNINLHQVALNLLKQLPPETKIPKLGNLTAAELILKVETVLKIIDREMP